MTAGIKELPADKKRNTAWKRHIIQNTSSGLKNNVFPQNSSYLSISRFQVKLKRLAVCIILTVSRLDIAMVYSYIRWPKWREVNIRHACARFLFSCFLALC